MASHLVKRYKSGNPASAEGFCLNCQLADTMRDSLEFMTALAEKVSDEDHVTLFEQTMQVLEWGKLLGLVAAHTHSTMGAALVKSCVLTIGLEEARRSQQETTEMTRLQESADP